MQEIHKILKLNQLNPTVDLLKKNTKGVNLQFLYTDILYSDGLCKSNN